MDKNDSEKIMKDLKTLLNKSSASSIHLSLYTIFFDYLKSAPDTETHLFSRVAKDTQLLLAFFDNLKENEKPEITAE